MPLTTNPLPQADREQANKDRELRQQLERAVNLLRRAEANHEVAETVGKLSDGVREDLRKLRTKARSIVWYALEADRPELKAVRPGGDHA